MAGLANRFGLSTHFDRGPGGIAGLAFVAAALAVGASVGVAWVAGFGAVGHSLAHANLVWLPVAFAGEIAAYAGYMLAYREVTAVESGPRLDLTHVAALVAAGFGAFVARGGSALDRHALERAGVSRRDARVRVLGLGALEYAVLAPAACVCAIYLLLVAVRKPSDALTLPWAVAVPVGAVVALLALRHRRRLRGRGHLRDLLAQALDAIWVVRRLIMQPRRHGLGLLGVTGYFAGDIFCLWASVRAFAGSSPTVAQLIIGYATGYALTRRNLPLAGAGAVEALLPFALDWVGVALAPAFLAVVAYRLFNFWLPFGPALAGLREVRKHDGTAGETAGFVSGPGRTGDPVEPRHEPERRTEERRRRGHRGR